MKEKAKKSKKGFTLIELLVVIAIIAILSVVVILTLNPAELLRQSRDSNRISDLSVTKSAIAFYLVSAAGTLSITSGTAVQYCYMIDPLGTSTAGCMKFASTTMNTAGATTTTSTSRNVNGTGWIPINFSQISAGGPPLAQLPADPLFSPTTGNATYFYAYVASSTGLVYKLDAHMESQKYGYGGSNDVVSTDGGEDTSSYEVGSNLLQL